LSAENWVEAHFDVKPGTRRGSWLSVNCPFCVDSGKSPDTKYHLGVNFEKHSVNCFRCHYRRSLVSVVMAIEHCSFPEAFEILGGRILSANRLSLVEKRLKRQYQEIELPREYRKLSVQNPRHKAAIRYLANRGIDLRTAQIFGFGFCVTGDYAQRVIIPVRLHGSTIGFTARTILNRKEEPLRYKTPQGFSATNFLFNYDVVKNNDYVVVVEGPMDAMKLCTDAVALFTNAMSPAQQLQIVRTWNRVIVLLDRAATEEAQEIRKKLSGMVRCSVATLEHSKDPGEADRFEIARALAEAREGLQL
jgi:DNA primase